MSSPLPPDAQGRLDALLAEVRADPARIAVRFPAVARLVARGPGDPDDPDGLVVPRLEDTARVAVLAAAAGRWTGRHLAEEVTALHRHGDADEQRAVLRALDALPALDPLDAALPLVTAALRSNDPRLVAAALGRYAADHLPVHPWRHGVLKCLFLGVPLAAVTDLATRADPELARMTADYVRERTAAGRTVPADTALILQRFPAISPATGVPVVPPAES